VYRLVADADGRFRAGDAAARRELVARARRVLATPGPSLATPSHESAPRVRGRRA
jgi:hypothetical protein